MGIPLEDEVLQNWESDRFVTNGKPGFNDSDIVAARRMLQEGATAEEISGALNIQYPLVQKFIAANAPKPATVKKKRGRSKKEG